MGGGVPCGKAALLTPFSVAPWRDMVAVLEANLGWVCTWHTHPAGMDPREWQAKAVVTYPSRSLPTAPGTWAEWWDRALHWARDGSAVAAYPDLPREPVSVQPWTVSLHLPTVAARLVAADPGVMLLGDREEPGLLLGRGLEVRTARLPSPVQRNILEGLQFTLTELMCGPPSIANSQTNGPRCSGPLATSVWLEWKGAYGPPTTRARRWWSCP